MYCNVCGHTGAKDDAYCYRCGRGLTPSSAEVEEVTDSRPSLALWRGGQVAVGILVVLAALFPVVQLSLLSAKLAGPFGDAVGLWQSSHLMGLTIVAVVWFLAIQPHRLPLSSLGFTLPALPWRKTVILTSAVLGASMLFTILYALLVEQLGWPFLAPPEIPSNILFPGAAVVFTYEALAFWTPFTEEIFFRGFVFAGLVPRFGVAWAMVASALIFSAFHVTPGVIVPIFITGILLAWLYHRTGSLWPGIGAHAGQNTLAILFTSFGV